MCLNYKPLFIAAATLWTAACSAGFLGLAPVGDRKEYVQARDLYNSGRYDRAITELTEYIYKTKNVKRREARAYRLLGASYEQQNNLSKALEVYLEALEFHPNNTPLLAAAANLYQQTGLTNRSIELYDRVLTQEPNNLDALSGQAANYSAMGFYSKARQTYDHFFELNPTADARYRARYAETFLRQRNFENAFTQHYHGPCQITIKNPEFLAFKRLCPPGARPTARSVAGPGCRPPAGSRTAGFTGPKSTVVI